MHIQGKRLRHLQNYLYSNKNGLHYEYSKPKEMLAKMIFIIKYFINAIESKLLNILTPLEENQSSINI